MTRSGRSSLPGKEPRRYGCGTYGPVSVPVPEELPEGSKCPAQSYALRLIERPPAIANRSFRMWLPIVGRERFLCLRLRQGPGRFKR